MISFHMQRTGPAHITAETLTALHGRLTDNVFSAPETELVEHALLELARSGYVRAEMPGVERFAKGYERVSRSGSILDREASLFELYARLHAAGSGYSPEEEDLLSRTSGCHCQPGGILPLVLAGSFIGPGSTVADLGAGNGLQGLLLQCISPHRLTVQIELSARMISTGRMLQHALGIGEDRVEWINADIKDSPHIGSADLVYLYRPAKPIGQGRTLYRHIARRLSSSSSPQTIVSVADCLGGFLDDSFSVLLRTDILSCFYKPGGQRSPDPAKTP